MTPGHPNEDTRQASALAQPPRPTDHSRRFQLTEPMLPGSSAEAHPLYWDGSYWHADEDTTFEVHETLGKFWGAKNDRGIARPSHDVDDGPFWEVSENPGRPFYWAFLDEALPWNDSASATLRDGSGGTEEILGTITLWAPLLTEGELDAASLVRVAMDLSGPRWVAVGAPC